VTRVSCSNAVWRRAMTTGAVILVTCLPFPASRMWAHSDLATEAAAQIERAWRAYPARSIEPMKFVGGDNDPAALDRLASGKLRSVRDLFFTAFARGGTNVKPRPIFRDKFCEVIC
jgi:hypothetical protein